MSNSAANRLANPDFAVVLLAAGTSSRLGRPKQLLPYKSTTLIRERVNTIRQAFPELEQLIVVTGASREAVLEALQGTTFKEAFNASFENGMGSSVKTGLEALSKGTQAAFFLLVDQPLISQNHLLKMAKRWEQDPEKVVAAAYSGILGVPAIFSQLYFQKLLVLEGDKGARKVLSQMNEQDIIRYHLPEAAVDIDSEKDLQHLSNHLISGYGVDNYVGGQNNRAR